MKKQNLARKLSLKLETLAPLQSDELAGVAGGIVKSDNCTQTKTAELTKTIDVPKNTIRWVTGKLF